MKKRIYSEEELPCWLSAADISAYLGLGLTSTYELLNESGTPKIVHHRRILVPRDRFLDYLDQRICEEQSKRGNINGQKKR